MSDSSIETSITASSRLTRVGYVVGLLVDLLLAGLLLGLASGSYVADCPVCPPVEDAQEASQPAPGDVAAPVEGEVQTPAPDVSVGAATPSSEGVAPAVPAASPAGPQ